MYTFSYKNSEAGYTCPEVDMRVPDYCNVTEILEFFQSFLVATGYIFDQDDVIKVVKIDEGKETPLTFNRGDINVTDDGTWRVRGDNEWVTFAGLNYDNNNIIID